MNPRIISYGNDPMPHSCKEVIWKLEQEAENAERRLKVTSVVLCSCGEEYKLVLASFWYDLFSFYYRPKACYVHSSCQWVRCG